MEYVLSLAKITVFAMPLKLIPLFLGKQEIPEYLCKSEVKPKLFQIVLNSKPRPTTLRGDSGSNGNGPFFLVKM